MTQKHVLYQDQIATVLGAVMVAVDEKNPDGSPTGRKVPQDSGKVKVTFWDSEGAQHVRTVDPSELTTAIVVPSVPPLP